MSKMLALIAGISVLALAGTASAGAPVSLTNAQMDRVTAGSSEKSFDFTKNLKSTSDNNVKFTSKSDITDKYNKTADYKIKAYVKGNSADFSFDNQAVGRNSNVQGWLSQETVAGQGSSQSGSFTSVASGNAPRVVYNR